MEPDIEVKVPKNALDAFALFTEIIKAKFSIFFRVFKKFRIILSLLFICSVVSVIYLLFTDSTGMGRVYAVIPIVLLLIVYLLLRTYVTFRSQIEVVNPVLEKASQIFAQAKPDSSLAQIDKKLSSRLNLNMYTWFVLFILVVFIIYLISINISGL